MNYIFYFTIFVPMTVLACGATAHVTLLVFEHIVWLAAFCFVVKSVKAIVLFFDSTVCLVQFENMTLILLGSDRSFLGDLRSRP